jgi:hypothetical protein
MRFPLFHYLGGLLWWLFIKFCKTDLEDEQSEEKWSRNVFFMMIIIVVLMFISVKFF